MRRLATVLALFSCCVLTAQPLTVTENRELPRHARMPYATADAAAKALAEHRYGSTVDAWTQEGGVFKAAFTVPFAWTNRQVLMRIFSASTDYELWINGHRAAVNADGNTPADFNLTKWVKEGRNEAEIRLIANGSSAIEGWKTDPAPQLGAVQLFSAPTMGVRDLFVQTRRNDAGCQAEIGVVVKSYALNPRTVRIYYDLLAPNGEPLATGHNDLTLRMRGEDTLRFLAQVPDTLLWSRENPQQCRIRLRTQRDGRYMEYHDYPVGLRTVEAEADGTLRINGEAVILRTTEVEPTATVEQLQQLYVEGFNLLYVKTGTVAPHFYTTCDELGLYVVAQAPIDSRNGGTARTKGGNPSNDPAWTANYVERVENCYHTAKSHPSVVGFSMARHSANGIALYESYLRLKQYDDPRPILYPEAAGEWNSDWR